MSSMTLRYYAGRWWVAVYGTLMRHATLSEVFRFAPEYQYDGWGDE